MCSTQWSIKFIKLINIKMPTITIVGISTSISMINKTSEAIFVTIAMVKVELIPDFYTWAIVLIN